MQKNTFTWEKCMVAKRLFSFHSRSDTTSCLPKASDGKYPLASGDVVRWRHKHLSR